MISPAHGSLPAIRAGEIVKVFVLYIDYNILLYGIATPTLKLVFMSYLASIFGAI